MIRFCPSARRTWAGHGWAPGHYLVAVTFGTAADVRIERWIIRGAIVTLASDQYIHELPARVTGHGLDDSNKATARSPQTDAL